MPPANLTKREWFAGMAMQGFIAEYPMNKEKGYDNFTILAECAVRMADALIAKLNENQHVK